MKQLFGTGDSLVINQRQVPNRIIIYVRLIETFAALFLYKVATLPCEIWGRYFEYLIFQRDGAWLAFKKEMMK